MIYCYYKRNTVAIPISLPNQEAAAMIEHLELRMYNSSGRDDTLSMFLYNFPLHFTFQSIWYTPILFFLLSFPSISLICFHFPFDFVLFVSLPFSIQAQSTEAGYDVVESLDKKLNWERSIVSNTGGKHGSVQPVDLPDLKYEEFYNKLETDSLPFAIPARNSEQGMKSSSRSFGHAQVSV